MGDRQAPRFLYIYPTQIKPSLFGASGHICIIYMKLNEQLKSLYSSKWKETCTALQALTDTGQAVTKPSYPFLLSVVKWENDQPNEEWYADADLKS